LDGKVLRHRVQRPQRREVEGRARPTELGDAFRPAQVTEVVDAAAAEEPAVRHLVSHELGSRAHRLSASPVYRRRSSRFRVSPVCTAIGGFALALLHRARAT
jgi:hypothetical protein